MDPNNRIPLTLFLLRLSIFIVMLVWTVDKFVQPQHAVTVYEHFYYIGGLTHTVVYVIGALELVLLAAFVAGYRKRISYGIVLLLHGVSTVSSYQQYLSPFEGPNLLFFAAIPMLAACFTLYTLREQDRLWTLDK
jgi:putative oxidoreductase